MKRFLPFVLSTLLLAVPARAAGTFHATFLQNWKCRDWTADEWKAEFAAAKAAGFDALILQSCCDVVRGDPAGGADPQDPAAYPDSSSFCMYPSEIPALAGAYRSSQNGGDALALALDAAEAADMKLWIGTVNDDLWWKYGWGLPASDGNGGTFFETWCADNAALCAALVAEIRSRYGATRGDRIAGWYYVNEIWNLDAACAGTDGGLYARALGANAAATVEAAAPDEPVLFCPFWNPDLSSPAQFGAFLSNVVAAAGFRPVDVCAPQDGGGAERAPADIREWALAQKAAVGGSMRFWIDCETFGTDFSAKSVADLRANFAAVEDLVDGAVVFSWSHYYGGTDLEAPFAAFALEGARDRTATPVPVPFEWLAGRFPARVRTAKESDALAEADTDGDGFANWKEFLCGTSPTNGTDFLRATIRMEGATPVVGWNLKNPLSGARCVVEGSPALPVSESGWTSPAPANARFFRVRVLAPGE